MMNLESKTFSLNSAAKLGVTKKIYVFSAIEKNGVIKSKVEKYIFIILEVQKINTNTEIILDFFFGSNYHGKNITKSESFFHKGWKNSFFVSHLMIKGGEEVKTLEDR